MENLKVNHYRNGDEIPRGGFGQFMTIRLHDSYGDGWGNGSLTVNGINYSSGNAFSTACWGPIEKSSGIQFLRHLKKGKCHKLRTYILLINKTIHVSKKSRSLDLYDFQRSWTCQEPPNTMLLGSGATKLLKSNQEISIQLA